MSDSRDHEKAAGPTQIAWLVRAAWLSILLGVGMQVLTAVALRLTGPGGSFHQFLTDVSQKVTWAAFVCVGLAVGNTLLRARAGLVGLIGLLAAPAAFVTARSVQKGVAGSLNLAPPEALGNDLFAAILVIKGAEYAVLGGWIAWLSRRGSAGFKSHIYVGSLVGVVFGGIAIATVALGGDRPPTTPKLATLAVNELLFPIGCAIVLFATGTLGQRLTALTEPARAT